MQLLIGPVGAGKSTYARRLVARSPAVFLDLDTWMVRLFGADPRPAQDVLAWYLERRERCRELLWDTAASVMDAGGDVVLELGLVGAAERQAFYERVTTGEYALTISLIDAAREVRRQRVLQRNADAGPHTQVVPPAFFEQASDAWEPPDADERRRWAIVER